MIRKGVDKWQNELEKGQIVKKSLIIVQVQVWEYYNWSYCFIVAIWQCITAQLHQSVNIDSKVFMKSV